MKKVTQLTPKLLKKIIEEEAAKFGKMQDTEDAAKDTEETDADEYADSLEKHIDHLKANKIEEARLVKRLQEVRQQRERMLKTLVKKI